MNRPWKIWLVFGLSLAVVLAAMGWVSLTTLRLDRAQVQSGQQAELEERVRLALWRMDSSLAPLIAEESARPYQTYFSFYPAEQTSTKVGLPPPQSEWLVPSPLLTLASSNILLHFQFWSDGALTSPQVPVGSQRELAESRYKPRAEIEAAANRLSRLQSVLLAQASMPSAASFTNSVVQVWNPTAPPVLRNGDVLINQCANLPTNTVGPISAPALTQNRQLRQSSEGQQSLNSAEWNARANIYVQVQQQAFANRLNTANFLPLAVPGAGEGPLRALWLDHELLLAHRVNLDGRFVVQGCWLNWTNLKQSLLASVADLLPAANLQPRLEPSGNRQDRLLAALPVKLVSGPLDFGPAPASSPVRLSMAVAWFCVLLAGVAVAVLLHGALSLSERRGAFVSAVTHELRTPLTTFKMYSEMLAEGMVQEETKRRQYLDTLCAEANRLSHLVENVLAYARLERGSARSGVQKLTLGELLVRVKPRLAQRAEQAGLTLVEDATDGVPQTVVHVDVPAVEQILFNLVDNACKYAAPTSTEKLIHLEALAEGKCAMLRVRDHGQGISAAGAKRLFRPFAKSAHEAAQSAPGIGLGLALCRRLSRSLGGDLRWDAKVQGGACFELRLPIGPREQTATL